MTGPEHELPRGTRSPRISAQRGVELRGVTKSFVVTHAGGRLQRVTALSDVSFSVGDGEFVSLLGPSGCGKTTTLRIIAGLEKKDSGEVRVNGGLVTRPSPDVSMVFQTFNLLPWRTVTRNVELGLELQRITKDTRRKRVERYLDLVNLGNFADHYPHQLSGGMQQRVGLARALAVESPVLLMDEPFGALDAMTRELLQRELLMILGRAEPRRTVIFVTHGVDEAIYLSDVILVFQTPGKVVRRVEIDLPHPRYEADVRRSRRFLDLRSEVLSALNLGGTHLDHDEASGGSI